MTYRARKVSQLSPAENQKQCREKNAGRENELIADAVYHDARLAAYFLLYSDQSQEISRDRAIPVATPYFARTLEGAQTALQQEGTARARHPQLRLDPDLPFISRQSLGMAQFRNGAERIILLDMILGLVLCARFQTNAVDTFDPDTIATNDGWRLGG
ncbi:MAG: hypothetical protein WB868_08905, partial [Xanthobacteraceae bacterium]